jgi:class 3 adenylate cyclase
MAVGSILCVDGDLDVHDTASAAVKAAIERHRELHSARIGVAVGDLDLGDPLGFAKRLCELADRGTILVTDSIRRAVAHDQHALVDLGAISASGHLDRVHVFELDGLTSRERTVLSLELSTLGRPDKLDDARVDAEAREHDRRVWSLLAKHRGFVERSLVGEYVAAFASPLDAFRAAVAIVRDLETLDVRVHAALEHGGMLYSGDRWVGPAWATAQRIRSRNLQQLASTMTAVEAVDAAELAALGLVIEVVEEVIQRGVRDPVRVAQLQIT